MTCSTSVFPVARLDLLAYRGDNFNQTILWKDATTDEPIDLTGYTARMQIKKTANSETLTELTEANGLNLGGLDGTVEITLDSTQSDIASTDNVYDLEVTSPGGVVTTLITGAFKVQQDVSRD